MAALNDLPAEILHQIAELCSKADLLSLRLTFWRLYNFLSLYVDKHLASEVRSGTHTHLHRAVATSDDYGGIILARLLNVSAPVDQRDKNSETALHVAFRVGNINGVYTLLNSGSDASGLSIRTCRVNSNIAGFRGRREETGSFWMDGTALCHPEWTYGLYEGPRD